MNPEIWARLLEAVVIATRTRDGLAEFMLENHRLPRIGDDKAPWGYRGWLLPIAADVTSLTAPAPHLGGGTILHFPGRWGYWLEAHVSGRFPREPPPQIVFSETGNGGRRNLERCVEYIGRYEGFGSAVGHMIDWLAWALAVESEPPRMTAKVQEHLYREFSLDWWRETPADYLGWIMSEHKGRGRDPSGFFPTPFSVVHLLTDMTFMGGDRVEMLRQTVMDPCVGTGRMLLAASNYSLCLYGQDINPRCVQATLVNGAVYAPWIPWPFAPPGADDVLAAQAVQEVETGQLALF